MAQTAVNHPYMAVSCLILLISGAFGGHPLPTKTSHLPTSPSSRRLHESSDYNASDSCESFSGRSCFDIPDEGLGMLAVDLSEAAYADFAGEDINTHLLYTLGGTRYALVSDYDTDTEAFVVQFADRIFVAFRG
jgi:hypothetical protein